MTTRPRLIHRGLLSLVMVLLTVLSRPISGEVSLTPLTISNPDPQPGAAFGYWIATGDVNNDGTNDLAVGSYFADVQGQRDAGRVDIFFGGPTFDNTADVTLQSPMPQAGEEFGTAIAIGDVNGDQWADLIISAEEAHVGDEEAGLVFVYFGEPGRLDPVPDLVLPSPEPQEEAEFGRRVATGDVNGDGGLDILVGAPMADVNDQRDAGEVDLFLGGRGIDATADARLRARQPQAGALFGFSIVAGDLNADGFDDVAVGALLTDVGRLGDAGRAEVFFGAAALPEASALILEAPTPRAGDRFGFPVDVGDINGDGVTDLLVGAYFTNVDNRANAGKAYIYQGGRSFDGLPENEIVSPVLRAGARFGYSFAVGDIVGDERPDLVVGADLASLGLLLNAGEAFIFDGGVLSGGNRVVPLQAPRPELRGSFGFRLAVADLNGDGQGDLIVSAMGASAGSRREAGAVYVYLSGGNSGQ